MNEILGISEAFNHAFEWRSRGADSMIRRDVSPALRATDYKCPKYVWYKSNETNMNEDKNQERKIQEPINAMPNFRIRKLTPRECFRLMDVDDKDIDKIQAAGISDSQQYKLAGNSIVVNVLTEIFRTLLVDTQADDGQLIMF